VGETETEEQYEPAVLTDILDRLGIPTELSKLVDLLDRAVVVNGIEEHNGTYGPYLIVSGYDLETGTAFLLATGGTVIVRKLRAVANELPVACRFVKPGRHYDVV